MAAQAEALYATTVRLKKQSLTKYLEIALAQRLRALKQLQDQGYSSMVTDEANAEISAIRQAIATANEVKQAS